MTNLHDQQLAKRVLEGSEAAFVALIRRYERVLAGLIRSRIGSGEQVRDVMQETLVHAWCGLRRATPRDVRPWLLLVARNRCRDHIRKALGVTPTRRKIDMKERQRNFPRHRPEIRIHPSAEKSLRVDFTEMAWWFVVPVVGDRTGWGMYDRMDGPDESWCLTETTWLTAQRPAVINGRACVEVEVEEGEVEKSPFREKPLEERSRVRRVWGHLADDEVDWIAVEREEADGVRELTTFLDDKFHDDWWGLRRAVEDCGCLSELADGTWVRQPNAPAFTGAGVFDVHVGGGLRPRGLSTYRTRR